MERTIGLFLADDHALVRDGIAALLSKAPDMAVVGQCGDGLKVLQEVLRVKPDVVILDLTMPGMNGLDVCRQLARKAEKTAILVLTMHADEEFIVQALKNGATGYLLKESAGSQLLEAIRTVVRREVYLGPGIPQRVLVRLAEGKTRDPYDNLTVRERQVLQLVVEGKTSREVAEILKVSPKTVDTHRAHLMRKLNLPNHTALVKFAIQRGIVQVD